MAGNSRFATAIHVAGMLSFADQMPLTSDAIAKSVNTNPVVIRRIIGLLTRHGIVQVKMGTGGGARLTKAPAGISLAEIYQAIESDRLFDVPQFDESFHCEIGKVVRPILAGLLMDAERGMIEQLEKKTLFDVIEQVKTQMAECGKESRIAQK